MRKATAVLIAAALVAGAFFLPAMLSEWSDQRLLDEPHITRQEEEREGFAESLQLSIAEKLLLLRSSDISIVALEDYITAVVHSEYSNVEMRVRAEDMEHLKDPDVTYELEENNQKWEERFTRVLSEVRSLQTLGALPYLWELSDSVECTGHNQVLYIDPESQISFLVYNMYLYSPTYLMNLMVDAKTSRILSFRLSWDKCPPPSWGFQGTSKFGTAWRDYWGMDSVSSAWNTEYIHSILEMPVAELNRNGSYNSNADISFGYDGQTLRVPLVNWVNSGMDGALEWNYM